MKIKKEDYGNLALIIGIGLCFAGSIWHGSNEVKHIQAEHEALVKYCKNTSSSKDFEKHGCPEIIWQEAQKNRYR